MIQPFARRLLAAAALLAVAAPSVALAQHPAPPAPAPTTAKMQGGDEEAAWIKDPHWHAYYDLTVAAFAAGPAKVDVAGYEQKSFEIFRDFGVSKGLKPEAMQDHLKLIPRQMVQIVKEDPAVLASYDNFVAAAFGPR
jgi:hypothetical protein